MKVIAIGDGRGVFLKPSIVLNSKAKKDLIIWGEDNEGLNLGDGSGGSYRLNHTEVAQLAGILQTYLATRSIINIFPVDEFKGTQAENLAKMVKASKVSV